MAVMGFLADEAEEAKASEGGGLSVIRTIRQIITQAIVGIIKDFIFNSIKE